ncbi:hypothetical protein CsSME_00046569 [Camellia sinensis var. sinensis]
MVAVRQNLCAAIADNKEKFAELEKLKASLATVEEEHDRLAKQLAKAEEEKQEAMQATKARYIAKLRKLRDAHKAELEKQVDNAEDRDYVEGEKLMNGRSKRRRTYFSSAAGRLL